ncbi:MAG TPA: DUF4910 domain-containing protein, partial [Thermoanaerobaculia bacterium]
MRVAELSANLDASGQSRQMRAFLEELFPICRSITGDGLRATLRAVQRRIPIRIHEVPSGTKVLDWTIPDEWNVADAFVRDSRGERVIDFQRSNLHVVNYSEPVRLRLPLSQLRPHLFALPDHPEWIPYRTTYYDRGWGFCLTQRQLDALPDGEYEAVIDARLEKGTLSYGELHLPGKTAEEILVSTHCCHPSLANDNLSGIALSSMLAAALSGAERRYSYRFLFLPGTIGSIAWLARNEARASRIKHGLVLAGLGAGDGFTYKQSR